MIIQQISVFLDNTPGRLRAATKVLAHADINMRALTLADTADFGVMRVIAENPEAAMKALKAENFAAKATEVVGVEIEDTPGALDQLLEEFEIRRVNIEYMYAFRGSSPGKALVVFRVDKIERAETAVQAYEERA